jgi:hypothetical protein
MRNILALIGLFVVGFGAIGWYCNWYTLKVDRTPEGTLQIKTEVHTDKVADDSGAFFEKLGQIAGEKGDRPGRKSQPATTPGNTPGPVGPVAPAAPLGPVVPATNKDGLKLQSGGFDGVWLLSPTRPVGTGK